MWAQMGSLDATPETPQQQTHYTLLYNLVKKKKIHNQKAEKRVNLRS